MFSPGALVDGNTKQSPTAVEGLHIKKLKTLLFAGIARKIDTLHASAVPIPVIKGVTQFKTFGTGAYWRSPCRGSLCVEDYTQLVEG